VLTAGVPEAERWLADLDAVGGGPKAALYPHREAFGEAEPHAEVAGERVETLERLSRGDVQILLTTPRAVLERTQLARAVQEARLELRRGDVWRPEDLAAHLARVGFERVPLVDDVGQYSVRGGIFDIYGFGMAEPVRLEFWGDEVSELRHFDLYSQRSTRAAEVAVVLPVDGGARAGGVAADGGPAAEFERVTLAELWTPDTVLFLADGLDAGAELRRTWDEAQHHLDLARRRGEDVPRRETLYLDPLGAERTLGAFGAYVEVPPDKSGQEAAELGFPTRAPEPIERDIRRLRRLVRDGMPTVILCDNAGQAERLDELLNEDERSPSPAALTIGVLGGGFVVPPGSGPAGAGLRVLTDHEIFRRERRIRRARKYSRVRRSTRPPRSSPATSWCTWSTASASTAASRPSSSAPAPSRSPSSSTRAATSSTSRSTASTRSSATAPPARPTTATRPRRGCTSWAAAAGRSSARRRAPPSRR
jgi:transcription-repair coupling factor (superfamily II helicase)